jgi:serine/threonine-protein kinase
LFVSGQADGFLFYVMPYVEGESLRDRLKRERELPVDEAVRLAKEVASALDYAHRHGIIHRDIKPENILLQDGQALVADFGISLAVSQAGASRMTETGLSLGTPSYMSPEQATGERILDARADVYSLGCLLYEMLVGEPPHTGPSVQAVIAAVVTKEPERLGARRPSVPANVEFAVHKALSKLPADRFATAEAFSKALSEPVTSATMATMHGFTGAARPSNKRLVSILAAALLVAIALGAWGWLRPRAQTFMNRFVLFLRPEEMVSGGANGGHIAISPDGRRIVYVARGEATTRLMMKEAGQVSPVALQGTDNATNPFFSPDGRQLGFIVNGTIVRILPLDAGSALTLTDKANTTAGDWGSDGYVYFETDYGLARIRSTGGTTDTVYAIPKSAHIVGTEWPVVLPGAKALLYRIRRDGQASPDYEIVVQTLPRGEPRTLLRGVCARYSPSGHLLVVTADGKLLLVPFDLGKLAVTGPPVALYEGLASDPFHCQVALSETGTLIYQTLGRQSSREMVWVNREGLATLVDSQWKPEGNIGSPALSPNGRQIALDMSSNGKTDIWVKQLPGGPFSRLTFSDTIHVRPAWSADGSKVLFLSDRGDGTGVVQGRRADGVGDPANLLPVNHGYGQVTQSSDGQWYVLRSDTLGSGDIVAVRTGDTTLVPLVHSPANEGVPALSPDSKWLAYSSDESGTFEVYVRPFPNASSARWQVSTAGGIYPQWSRDGKELFFRNKANFLVSSAVQTSPTFQADAQRILFTVKPYAFTGQIAPYAVGSDKRFLMMREVAAGDAGLLIVSEHWFDELKAREQK